MFIFLIVGLIFEINIYFVGDIALLSDKKIVIGYYVFEASCF